MPPRAFPVYEISRIAADLGRLGLQRGDCLVVHSSYKSTGGVAGGPEGLIDALAEVLLPEGALLFPNLNIGRQFTTEDPPRFDLKRDPVKQTIGILPELFKQHYAEYFSIHPTHSLMGIGLAAKAILQGHEKAGLPCGRGTPWEKNAIAGGKILLIGVGQGRNTTYHCAEEQIDNSYQLTADAIEGVVVIDGVETIVSSRLHVSGNHPDFSIIEPELEELGFLMRGVIGDAQSTCIDAGAFLQLCMRKMRADPRYFFRTKVDP